MAVGYALDALEPDELERFIHHLVDFCPECRVSVADTDRVGAGIAAALAMPEPPVQLRANILEAAFAVREPAVEPAVVLPAPTDPNHVGSHRATAAPASAELPTPGGAVVDQLAERRRSRNLPSRVGWLVAAAAVIAAVVMSVTAVSALNSRDDARSRANRAAAANQLFIAGGSGRLIDLRPTSGSGAMVAVVVAKSASVSVVPSSLAANSATTSYVLWGIQSATSSPVALGVFDVNSSRPLQVGANTSGYNQYPTFAISHEQGHTAPSKPTDVVAIGQA
jgi:hypothetical protein